MALGAFLAGLLFSNTEYRHQVNSDLEPFKGLLLALFFISVGMSADFGVIQDNVAVIVGGTLALLVRGGGIPAAAQSLDIGETDDDQEAHRAIRGFLRSDALAARVDDDVALMLGGWRPAGALRAGAA
mgnify:CR=1 FL=1